MMFYLIFHFLNHFFFFFLIGNCIMLVWRHGSTLQPCKCHLCRRPISLLVPSEDTIRDRNDSAVAEVLGNLETYNRLFGGRSTSLVQVYVIRSHSISVFQVL